MRYTINTLEFSRKRVDIFLSMRMIDRICLSGYSRATWHRWFNGERGISSVTLEEVTKSLSAHSPLLVGLNPMEVLAGILIMRSTKQKSNPHHPRETAQAG